MIKMRLIRLLKGSGKYILYQVLWQWISLIAQIIIAINITQLIDNAFYNKISDSNIIKVIITVITGVFIRVLCDRFYTDASFHAGANVKRILRNQIYEKVLRLGPAYREQVHTSEIVQMAGEGVEQLEVYFSRYLSQFFYSLLAPLTLFIVVMRISMKSAVILLIAVPLIPIVIMLVMLVAKRLLSSYFDIYYGLGDSFLEKLHGMTTLKIYRADKAAADDMDRESEQFRKITMKVLMMQLNSTSVMDIVAYGGAAVGIISALTQFYRGEISLFGMLMILFLAAEFFLPMRILGSFFHIGMNGMKASDRIFAFIDLPEQKRGDKKIVDNNINISLENLSFSYEPTKEILKGINMNIPPKSFVSLVGVSGSGKSTIAGILMGRNPHYSGSLKINDDEHSELTSESIMKNFTMVGHSSWIFAGTVRENLFMGNPNASVSEMNDALQKVNLLDFINSQEGLDTKLTSNAGNLSGGQKQRLSLARALLHNTPVYIFDEATSNVDAGSEEIIMNVIHELAKEKTIILISHRLANVVKSDNIFMLKDGNIVESGVHSELMANKSAYENLFTEQMNLENFSKRREAMG
ncbi:ABC transporter ATP-binding protein/permease [Lachnoanaerobaculum sp. Marseille-Q4761]|uniref:ABC transporter ATP-binding protein/permease n=1 Tax=Lachnoanaerobaculum sp. Marseille-Q4761 TaxID=2819511 RepID=UPI001AA1D3D0|nr:ABC transporter ATP-binding protein/permease [Lachnoanaerobaculum sp. Marseille-Q4761]MBO1872060.1 ABC transporter ATP-binding protein/permease [Lachnoanaerobaculum sp. Marseille-Q4761]